MTCPAEDVIVDMLEGRLDEASRDDLTSHLDSCVACRWLIADAARGIDSRPATLVRGANVGRYVVFGPVGSGSMGTVYAAYDPELDRKVALKLLRADALAGQRAAEMGPRLRREAQALAKLSHPNVVAVYDVGRVGDDELFIAMEFVEGSTLTDWLHERPRTAREIVRVFREAGLGLAAAHAVGIVHRDFKPENVLIGKDGRAKVGDFGLASAADGRAADDAPGGGHGAGGLRATRTGALVGTPAYMAPEQWAGKATDARTDVFGFSVALFEALYGARPFAADDAEALARAMREEAIAEPQGARVPSWLARIVRRGLRADPAARWPAMPPMLDALASGPPLTLRRGVAIALALALVPAAGVGYARLATRAPPPCTGALAAWGDTWSANDRGAIRAAFERTGRKSAAHAVAQIEAAVDDFRARWVAMRTDACMATRVRGEQSEALLDVRMACLDDRRREAAALARELASADATTVDRWSSAVGGLAALDQCANATALTAAAPPPSDPAARARADALSGDLAGAKALYGSGKYARARDAAGPIATEAQALPYPTVAARALLLRGDAEHRMNALDDARRDLHAAAAAAMAARDDATAADAWTLLTRIDGSLDLRPREGKVWGRYAEAALGRVGGDDEREATLQRTLATLEWGDDRVTLDLLRRARSLYDKSREPLRSYYLSGVDETIAATQYLAGRLDEALTTYRASEAARVRVLGEEHPAVAASLGNEADCLLLLGRLEEALANWERAARVVSDVGGDETWWRIGRAQVLRAQGRYAAALDDDRRAGVLAEAGSGADSPPAAEALTGQGLDLLGLGRAGEAREPLERALAIRQKVSSRKIVLAESLFALARAIAGARGDRARAIALAGAARDALRPDAERYGSYYAEQLRAVDAWLAQPR